MNKFQNTLVYTNVHILMNTTLWWKNNIEILYQIWVQDNIKCESLVFDENDVAHLSDDEILDRVSSCDLCAYKDDLTLMRNCEGYTIVNFDFDFEQTFHKFHPTIIH